MKRIFLLSALALLAVVGCSEKEAGLQEGTKNSGEIAVAPFNGEVAQRTKGYTTDGTFYETYRADLHATSPAAHARDMKLSAYLYPQNGEQKNYFVGKTYAKGESDDLWHAKPAIYWPVGGTMDFLAYSLSGESGSSKNVTAVWNNDNAAKQVVLTVPGENTQNDILFASAAGIKSSDKKAVDMKFNHAQAWLEFAVTGTPAGIVHLQKIELEDVYNAGTLTISNNSGNAVATWDFAGEEKQNIAVDNFNNVKDLNGTAQYLDMLIPQQTKTNFVIYYTLGTDTKVLQYRFGTDLKTWLMGEKYVYNINISTSEVTVNPIVTSWEPAVIETESIVKVSYDAEIGTVEVEGLGDPVTKAIVTDEYNTGTWGQIAKLTAKVNDDKAGDYRFEKWSDGSTENPRYVEITSDTVYEALFTDQGPVITVAANEADCGKVTINGEEVAEKKVAPGEKVTIKAIPTEREDQNDYVLVKWNDENTSAEREVTVNSDINYTANFGIEFKAVSNDETMGTITVKDAASEEVTPVEGKYTVIGKTATITAVPATNYSFKKWVNTSAEPEEDYTVTTAEISSFDGSVDLRAEFFILKAIAFTASVDSKVIVKNNGSNAPVLEYSTDGLSWTSWDYSEQSIPAGEVLYVRGTNKAGFSSGTSKLSTFKVTGSVSVSGNIMHLLDYKEEMDMTTIPSQYCFIRLFTGCSGLVDASKLELPAKTLTSLCYSNMFEYCSYLTSAPELPATTLANSCYKSMFSYCSKLTAAPELPATTLASGCYSGMFAGCTNLSYIKCLATDISASNCLNDWVGNISSTGTFVKKSGVDWPEGDSGIPTGWDVQTE